MLWLVYCVKVSSWFFFYRPNGTTAWNLNSSNSKIAVIKVSTHVRMCGVCTYMYIEGGYTLQGPLFEEVQQTFSGWLQQNIRVHKDSPFVEFDYIVGPIPIKWVYISHRDDPWPWVYIFVVTETTLAKRSSPGSPVLLTPRRHGLLMQTGERCRRECKF